MLKPNRVLKKKYVIHAYVYYIKKLYHYNSGNVAA